MSTAKAPAAPSGRICKKAGFIRREGTRQFRPPIALRTDLRVLQRNCGKWRSFHRRMAH